MSSLHRLLDRAMKRQQAGTGSYSGNITDQVCAQHHQAAARDFARDPMLRQAAAAHLDYAHLTVWQPQRRPSWRCYPE